MNNPAVPRLTPLRRVVTAGGDVLHGMKAIDPGYAGFGEAYFTTVERGFVKGWKQHKRMTLNLVVPYGEIRIVVRMAGGDLAYAGVLGPDIEYARLTVPPGCWVAFGGVGEALNLMMNVASLVHDPQEAESRPIEAFAWSWTDDLS